MNRIWTRATMAALCLLILALPAMAADAPANGSDLDVAVDVDCFCFGAFNSGDRVTATLSNPQFSTDLPHGRGGTVICGTTQLGPSGLLVSWDDWQNGHDGDGYCECPVDSLADNSGWYVGCTDVTPSVNVDCACSGEYDTGDRIVALVDHPSGQSDVYAGDLGTVISGWSGGGILVVSFDGLTSGHYGQVADCPPVNLDNPSGWFVECDEIELVPDGHVDTIAAALDASPDSGTTPFITAFTAQLVNLTTENRRAAARIDVIIGNGTAFYNWRAGWTNLSSLEVFTKSWNTWIPDIDTVQGTNIFTVLAEDVTPAPYNQPPFTPSGATAVAVETVFAY